MKPNFFTRAFALLALAGVMSAPAARAASATNGDLLLGVHATGGTGNDKVYTINLGQASTFTGATGPVQLTTSAVGTDLTALFGASWKTRSNVFWGVAGTIGSFNAIGSDPAKTLYATREQSVIGTTGTPWSRQSDTTQGTTTNKMVALITAFGNGTAATAANSVSQTTSDSNNWSTYQPGGTVANSGPAPGTSFAAFNPTIEGSFTNGTAGSVLDLFRMAPGTSGTPGDHVGRLIMNDSGVVTFIPVAAIGASTVQLAAATGSVSEDVAGGKVSITVNRTGDVSSACSVQLSTADGTAAAPADYTAISNQVVSFGINETSKTVDVTVVNRAGFQGDRTFIASLNTPSGATLGGTTSQTVTIQEAIEPSVLQFSASTFSANQNDTSINVTITRTGGGSAVTVKLSTSDDSATAPGDYTAITNQTVNIPALTNSVNVPVTLSAPAGNQPNKQFTVTLSTPGANASLGTPDTATVRILANDTTAPVITGFTNPTPAANATVSGSVGGSITVAGTASDDKGVDHVEVSVDNGAHWTSTTPSGSAWSVNVSPAGGLTSVMARAVDGRGNLSAVVTRSFTYKITSGLTVNVVGTGTVTGKLSGPTAYEVGKTYTLTAVPGTNQAFDNWAGAGLTAPATEVAKLTFVFTSTLAANPTLTATFVANPYLAASNVTGAYTGLIKAHTGTTASNSTNGLITVTITGTGGGFTGLVKVGGESLSKMTVAAASVPLAGVFDNNGVAKFGANRSVTATIPRAGGTPYLLSMSLDIPNKRIAGTLKAATRTAPAPQSDFVADRAAYSATVKVPATLLNVSGTSGYYTAVLPARSAGTVSLDPTVTFASSEFPQGDGYTTIKVTNTGSVTFAAVLGDGAVISSSTALLSSANKAVFFAQPYGGKGSIGGEIALTKPAAFVEVAGSDFFWFRPYQAVQHYPYGWPEGLLTDLTGSEYNVVAGSSVFPDLGVTSPNTNATFSDGLLSSSVSLDFNISTTNVVTGTGTTLGVVLNKATGVIGGAPTTFFTHTDGTKVPFKAMIVQKGPGAGAHGFFLTTSPKIIDGTGESGGVSLLHK